MHSKLIELIYCLPLLCCFIVQLKLAKGGISYSRFRMQIRSASVCQTDLWGFVFSLVEPLELQGEDSGWCGCLLLQFTLSQAFKNLFTISSWLGGDAMCFVAGTLRRSHDASPGRQPYKTLLAGCKKAAFSIMKCRKQSVRTLTECRLTFGIFPAWEKSNVVYTHI